MLPRDPVTGRTHRPGFGASLVQVRLRLAGIHPTTRKLVERYWLVLAGVLVVAAIARLPGLPGRGDFDADQGHDMLVLLRLVQDGQIPLLGPPTSIGAFHHGAAYYFLLAPLAWISGSDPVAVMVGIAALGIAAVGLTWWLARAIGGPVAGAIAGLLLAVSPAAVEESTFIWNPNPIPFFAILSLAAAWRARVSGRARWWTMAVGSAGMVAQLHVLGVVFLPPILAFGIASAVVASRDADRQRARAILAALGVGLAFVAVLFVPLVVYEFQTNFLETRGLIAYFAAAGGGSGRGSGGIFDPAAHLLFAGFRVIGWPLVGLVTSAPFAAIVVVVTATVIAIWLMVAGRGEVRTAARWLGLTIAWGAVALSVVAPSLQTVVLGLPNDHYHAFLDPAVVVLMALSIRGLAAGSGRNGHGERAVRTFVTVAFIGLLAFDVGRWPPTTEANGGWPAARAAGERIVRAAPGATFDVRSLPQFKTGEGIAFPIVAAGGHLEGTPPAGSLTHPLIPGDVLVVVCDRLFERAIGAACGGQAEARFMDQLTRSGTAVGLLRVDRFDASARTSISVYR